MRLRTETSLGIGALLALQIATSFAAIGLLDRLAPMVDRVIRDNVVSVEAVEEMKTVLASPDLGSPVTRRQFRDALARAQANVTEPAEAPRLVRVEALAEVALSGDPQARRETITLLSEVSEINRASMRKADAQMSRLGGAGAWAAALLGLASFAGGTVLSRRLRRRLEGPMVEIDTTLAAVRSGDPHRRAVVADGPLEALRIGQNVNWLLARGASAAAHQAKADRDRALLLRVLDEIDVPAACVGHDGAIVAANHRALGLWDGEGSDALTDLARSLRDGEETPGWRVEDIPAADAWICTRRG